MIALGEGVLQIILAHTQLGSLSLVTFSLAYLVLGLLMLAHYSSQPFRQ
jgi:hypothetical protein